MDKNMILLIKGNCLMYQAQSMIITRKTQYLILAQINTKHYQDFTISTTSGRTPVTTAWTMTSTEEKEKVLDLI